MKGEYSFDLRRIFLGDLPPVFLLEVLFRTAIIYGWTLLLVRLIGKRGMGQLSPFDFVIVIALGSAVGDPMFYDDVPLLHAMAVIALVVTLQRGVGFLSERSHRAQRFIESDPRRLVTRGVVDLAGLREEQLDREELFGALRQHGIKQLGQVERAYIETSGRISVLERDAPLPGRPLIPEADPDGPEVFEAAARARSAGIYSCRGCGANLELGAGTLFPARCASCDARHWVAAVK